MTYQAMLARSRGKGDCQEMISCTSRHRTRGFGQGAAFPLLCIAIVALLLIPAGVLADEWVGGIPLTTVQTGTVTGDLWMDIDPAPNWGDKDVTKTFTLPAAAVAEPGRIKWARLYISAYCGHMQNDYAFTMTTSFDGDGIAGYEHVWPETAHEQYYFATDPETWEPLGNDNSEFPGHGTGEPYLMLNDHETRVTSDYFAYYDVTDLITSQEVTVNVNTVGSFDGRIKVMSLVVAYDDSSSSTETTYWVNQGHDVCSYYVEDNFGYPAVGETSFATTGLVLDESDTATLYIDYMASNNGYYGFPTDENDFDYTGGTPPVTGTFTNSELDRDPDVQGAYSGVDSWDVKDYIDGSSDVTFAYARYFPGTGTSAFYKIPLAFLVVKKPLPVGIPVAAFSGTPTSGTAPLTVTFTDESINDPTSWAWDVDNDGTVDYTTQNATHTYTTAGTYSVTLTATNAAGSDDEVKTDYITVTGGGGGDAPVAAFSGTPTDGMAPLTVTFTDESVGSGTSERVTNGGFENGETGWVDTGNAWTVQSETKHSGSYAGYLDKYNGEDDGYAVGDGYALSQQIDLTNVDQLSLWYYLTYGEGPFPTLKVAIGSTVAGSYITTESWEQAVIDTSSYTGTHTISFYGSDDEGVGDIYIDDITATGPGLITEWEWDFGDGGTSDQPNPVHEYTMAGMYDVTLIVTDANGTDEEVKTEYITVTEPIPDIDLTIAGLVNCVPGSAVFAWEPNTVTVANIKNQGTDTATNIVVRLYASDVDDGNTAIAETTIATIAGGGSVSLKDATALTDPMIRTTEGTVTYTAKVDPDNLIAETNEANNNKSSVSKAVRYNGYKGKGIYWVGADNGGNITTRQTLDLNGDIVYYTQPDSAYRGVGWIGPRTETWTAADLVIPDGATVEKALLFFSYNWDQTPGGFPNLETTFNGNTIDLGTPYRDWSNFGAYADYEYGLYPAYDVTGIFNMNGDNTLLTNPGNGGADNKVALYPSTLVVIYSDPAETRKQIFINEEFDYLGVSQSSYGTTMEEATAYVPFSGMTIDTGSVQSATWHSFATNAGPAEGNVFFNGNNLANNVFTGSTYSSFAMVFDVKNYLTDTGNEAAVQGTESGGMGAIQQILVVEYVPTVTAPVANFSGTPTSGTAPLTVIFTDESTNAPTEWLWDFGDGDLTNNTMQNPVHTYASAGTYSVTLTATNSAGSDEETKTGYITVTTGVIPLPGYTVLPTDPDGDGLYEDLNGNGVKDLNDVVLFFKNIVWMIANEPVAPFDFNKNGAIDLNDVVLLYKEMV